MDKNTIDTPPYLANDGHPMSHKIAKPFDTCQSKINGFYIPFSVTTDKLQASIKSLIGLDSTFNTTIPHKTNVLSLADSVTDRAALIGATNTLYFIKNGKIHTLIIQMPVPSKHN